MSVSSCGLGGGIGRSLTVVYNGNGLSEGEVPEERGRFKTGDVVEVQGIGNMFKRGFNFQGWNTKADGSGFRYSPGFPIKMGEYNLTLYAQWGNQQYAVNYEGNGATSGEVPEGGLFSYGENFTVSGNIGGLTRAGRSFLGWNTSPDGSGIFYAPGATFEVATFNVTLYAQWELGKYQVVYQGGESLGGSAPNPTNHDSGEEVLISDNTGGLFRTGFRFVGWNTSPDGQGQFYASGQSYIVGEDDLVLYPVWQLGTYSLSFDGNGFTSGELPPNRSVAYFAPVEFDPAENTFSREGYTLVSWNSEPDGEGIRYSLNSKFSMPAQDIQLYAIWEINEYTLSFDGNGQDSGRIPNPFREEYGSLIVLPGNLGNLQRQGYAFLGWNSSPDGSGTLYASGTSLNLPGNDLTLYAAWQANEYNLVFLPNGSTGGSTPENRRIVTGESFALPQGTSLVRRGYSFAGWNTEPDGSGQSYYSGDNLSATGSDIRLYALWRINQYELSYQGNQQSAGIAPATQRITFGEEVTVSNQNSLVREGFVFTGWNSSPDGSGQSYSPGESLTMDSQDIVLYAQWEPATVTAPQ
jgi:uncharacterized repeat protein (TIGR02543 family)